jgi:hypothetical protein
MENESRLQRLFVALNAKSDRKCYFPFTHCKGFKRRRILIRIIERHCRQFGHVEGGYKYHPILVRFSLYVFVLIVFMNLSILLIFVACTNFI